MTAVEAIAAALGVVNVMLVIRRSVWNFPVAIVMVTLYGAVFFDARLYSDALLQLVFVALNIYGWASWTAARAEQDVPVRWMPLGTTMLTAGVALVGWAAWSTVMARLTDAAAPYWDGAVAVLSITAQILLARRYVENWLCWIAVNVLAVGLFWTRDLRLTAALYALFLAMAVLGFFRWRRAATAVA
jgi:nicotinamide mononucleotide transporter